MLVRIVALRVLYHFITRAVFFLTIPEEAHHKTKYVRGVAGFRLLFQIGHSSKTK
uniref:Uncharacterized protein n=1 Tax=Ciona intestinalis TaxID=7719 RepID=H2XNS5_CIOIN